MIHPSSRRPPAWGGVLAGLLALLLPGAVAARPVDRPPAQAAARLSGGFLEFWQAHNGAVLFGAPLTDEIRAGGVVVQYCERVRLEWHPDYPPGHQITLTRLGADVAAGRAFPGIAAFPSNPTHRYFAETGHSIGGELLRFWEAAGGVPIVGLPLSQELREDGRTVQYFERARLEHHPDLPWDNGRVLPTPLGALALQARGQAATAVVLEPPAVEEGHTLLVRVLPAPGTTVTAGTLEGRAIPFTCCLPPGVAGRAPAAAWGVAGADPAGVPATLRLRLILRHADGHSEILERAVPVRRYAFPTIHMTYFAPGLNAGSRADERPILDAIFARHNGPPRWDGPFRPPLDGPLVVNSAFGQRRLYPDEPYPVIHGGVDYDAALGTPIHAPAAGTVVLAQALPLRGNTVVLDHGAGVFTLYAHLSAFRVQVGQAVPPGAMLGRVGSTGNASGPHLHWELHIAGATVAAAEWLGRAIP